MNDVPARLVLRQGPDAEQEFVLTQESTIVGRGQSSDITIPDPEISRQHAQFTREGSSHTVVDLGSTNGTFVNGQRVTGPTKLKNGDIVELGEAVRLDFMSTAEPADATLAEPYSSLAQAETMVEPDWAPGDDVELESFVPPPIEDPSQRRWWIFGCGCLFLLVFGCAALLFFLDAYEGGRLLYCGPLQSFFEAVLGSFGFSPACALP
jgi:hypothetical protein